MSPYNLARLHQRAFAGRGQIWPVRDFEMFLNNPSVILETHRQCFALCRVVCDEAEILTIVCDPDWQGKGLATQVLHQLHAKLQLQSMSQVFLEVADDNAAARALYARLGYEIRGRRRAYYTRHDGAKCDALVLEKDLTL